MKKLSILVALILCVTIGGVYAAWSYTGSTTTAVDRTLSHGMATAVQKGDVGIFSITENNIDIKIDQMAAGDYRAKLVITGSVTVTFTPNDGAPEDVTESAIPAEAVIYLKNAEANQFEGKNIYTVTNTPVKLNWNKNGNSFTATITAENVASMLGLSDDLVLDTHEKYMQFHGLEENITITLAIRQSSSTASN